jgi:predicted transcriptional regulator
MHMKAIVEIAPRNAVFHSAARQFAEAAAGKAPDFRLSFESARTLFADLTAARLDLLDTLSRVGPCSVYLLAKSAARNYSNVHADVSRMEELGLIERTPDGSIIVPFEAIEIRLPLRRAAA